MTLTFLNLYNQITGQAWSMFDGDIESDDEIESNVATSIQKALSFLWNSYDFPFRLKTQNIKTRANIESYSLPKGKIKKRVVDNVEKAAVMLDRSFLEYDEHCEFDEVLYGKPEKFYFKNDKICFYPIPDESYDIKIDYYTTYACKDKDGLDKANFDTSTDYINIPEKYEDLFKNTLLPLAMYYGIASETDENSSEYKRQYERAYEILIDYCSPAEISKRIVW